MDDCSPRKIWLAQISLVLTLYHCSAQSNFVDKIAAFSFLISSGKKCRFRRPDTADPSVARERKQIAARVLPKNSWLAWIREIVGWICGAQNGAVIGEQFRS
jgi:hypothetical protein